MCWQGSSISNLQGQQQKLGEKLQNEQFQSWENRQITVSTFGLRVKEDDLVHNIIADFTTHFASNFLMQEVQGNR
jgi:hypothetical protein